MSVINSATAYRGEAPVVNKRRFLIRLVTVLIGGMFLGGYVLGIVGPVASSMAKDLQISAAWERDRRRTPGQHGRHRGTSVRLSRRAA